MTPTLLLILALIYVTLLFGVASYAERRIAETTATGQLTYALTLAVFCTSWTFYGAVGSMAANPWSHTPIYLGPIILLVIFRPLVDRLISIGHHQRVTSIADFLGARYGKRQSVGAVVAVICLLAVLPYLALQFRALQQIWTVVNTGEVVAPETSADNVTLLVAVGLALFAMLFGARRLDGYERQRGLMRAMAVESLVKLIAFVAIAGLATAYIVSEHVTVPLIPPIAPSTLDADFMAEVLLAGLAILVLPRQFHVTVVEVENMAQTRLSRWVFPLYLLLFMILAVPISVAGSVLFNGDPSVKADTYVQVLPMALGADWGVAAAFLGGISAATGMVLVATVSVSIMVTNELVTPLLYRVSMARSRALLNLGTLLRRSRQITVFVISMAAWLVAVGLSGLPALTEIGFLSFLGSAQLAPPLLMGLFWRRAHGIAVLTGMLAGTGVWLAYGLLPSTILPGEPLQVSTLTLASLGINTMLCVLLSLVLRLRPSDLRQADVFLSDGGKPQPLDLSLSPIPITQLDNLVSPLLSDLGAQRFWRELETTYEQRLLPSDRAPRFVVAAAEAVLANAVGASSASQIINRLESERQLNLRDLTGLLGNTKQGYSFNRESLEATVENLSHGVSVVDSELRLVAWNSRYEQMFDYPARFLFVGCPIERVYRFNAERGILASSGRTLEEEVERRLDYMRAGSAHQVERVMPDGRVLDIRGTPIPGGGFVTAYVDVTEYREMTRQLEEARQELEERLASGEKTLSERNAMLREEVRLRSQAETQLREAFQSKAEFMSATSHDLLQPINAARLFAGALRQRRGGDVSQEEGQTWQHLETALERTESMIAELREMARLDSGKQGVDRRPICLRDVLLPIHQQFANMAAEKGLGFRVIPSEAWIDSDPRMLHRLIENLVSNAIKYTDRGRILVGVRRHGAALRLVVCDTGPGIADEDQARIFQEFERLERGSGPGVDGLGLGLSLVQRYAQLLGSNVELYSVIGRGSVFAVSFPRVAAATEADTKQVLDATVDNHDLAGRLLLLDNDPSLLQGMTQLLQDMGFDVLATATPDEAMMRLAESGFPDVVIADNHLDQGATGLATAQRLRDEGYDMPVIIVSADDSVALREACRDNGFRFLPKPIEPQRLRALLEALLPRDSD